MPGYSLGLPLTIGTTLPPPPSGRGIQVGEADPAWFVLVTRPQAEDRARDWLLAGGASDAWFPVETYWRSIPRGKRRTVEAVRRVVPGYVFVRFSGFPQWDLIRGSRFVASVVGIGGTPMPIRDDDMARMEMVPQRLAVLREAQRQARVIRAGDRVRIRDGGLEGWIVDVSEVTGNLARLLVPILGHRLAGVPLDRLEKVAPGTDAQGLA